MKRIFLILCFTFVTSVYPWTHLGSNIKGWKTKKLTFYVNPTNCTLSETELYDLIDTAINAWNGVPHSGLELERATTAVTTTLSEFNNGTANQVPLILCDPAMSEPDQIPGYAIGPTLDSAGHIIYTGIILNATDGDAGLANMPRRGLEVTLAHELGHVLGLGHSADVDALMYYRVDNKPAILTQDDMDGMVHIYPRSEFSGGAFGCAAIHSNKKENPNFYWFWLGVLLVGLNVWIFRRIKLERLL